MITLINNTNSPSFGVKISIESVRRANQACIERGKLAKIYGLTLGEYNALNRNDSVRRIGDETFDFYTITKKITQDKEKLKKAFCDAWEKVLGSKSCK